MVKEAPTLFIPKCCDRVEAYKCEISLKTIFRPTGRNEMVWLPWIDKEGELHEEWVFLSCPAEIALHRYSPTTCACLIKYFLSRKSMRTCTPIAWCVRSVHLCIFAKHLLRNLHRLRWKWKRRWKYYRAKVLHPSVNGMARKLWQLTWRLRELFGCAPSCDTVLQTGSFTYLINCLHLH